MRKESCDNVISRRPFGNKVGMFRFASFSMSRIVGANADLCSLFGVGGGFKCLPLAIGVTVGIALGVSANRASRGGRASSRCHIMTKHSTATVANNVVRTVRIQKCHRNTYNRIDLHLFTGND